MAGHDITLGQFIDEFVDVIRQDSIVTTATAGDLHVEPEMLAGFYNELSDLHETLTKQIATLSSHAHGAADKNVGGLLPGGQEAWAALVAAAGANSSSESLVGNLKSVDALVVSHMAATKASLEKYVETDGQAVVGFGKAASLSGSGPATTHSSAPITTHAI